MTSSFSRSEEILARSYLAKPDLLAQAIIDKRWSDVATTVSFAETDAPTELASTDPGLYREIRESITRFYLRGGGSLDLEKIRLLSQSERAAAH
ncbi:hypothetical protein HQ447_19050 [bacterium]|nr:hypothetical protein [bacterium]